MRCLAVLALVSACGSSESRPPPEAKAAPKPPDQMDEKMRHCPLALDGATSTLEDIDGGVRFTIQAPDGEVDEARRRAHHIVDFAAKRTKDGHSGFDGKGGGRMKNCPVVTDGVSISASDIAGGARLEITSTVDQVEQLRTETRSRSEKFPFVGATIKIAAHP